MGVGIKVGSVTDEIGTSDFFYSFFCTIASNLESNGWGTRFPKIMNGLYEGSLNSKYAEDAIEELKIIKKELVGYKPESVVWDIEDLSKSPPWGDNISEEITSLANYFVTSTGRDLISTLLEALEDANDNNKNISIVAY